MKVVSAQVVFCCVNLLMANPNKLKTLGFKGKLVWLLFFFLKNGPPTASFCFIFVFSIQLTVNKQMFNIFIFADDWIRTADLWNWKRPLYQLSHNHCPGVTTFGQLLEKLGLLFIPTSGQPGVIESPTKYSHSSSSIRYILKTQKQSI